MIHSFLTTVQAFSCILEIWLVAPEKEKHLCPVLTKKLIFYVPNFTVTEDPKLLGSSQIDLFQLFHHELVQVDISSRTSQTLTDRVR